MYLNTMFCILWWICIKHKRGFLHVCNLSCFFCRCPNDGEEGFILVLALWWLSDIFTHEKKKNLILKNKEVLSLFLVVIKVQRLEMLHPKATAPDYMQTNLFRNKLIV